MNALVYLDDIIIFSDSNAEHMEDLNVVMNRLQSTNLTLKKEVLPFPDQCELSWIYIVFQRCKTTDRHD